MSAALTRLAENYPPALMAYLVQPDEAHLHSAYELGRTALADGINLLDLTRTHHAVVGPILTTTALADLALTFEATAAFLVEALAPYDIARSGFLEQTGTNPSTTPSL